MCLCGVVQAGLALPIHDVGVSLFATRVVGPRVFGMHHSKRLETTIHEQKEPIFMLLGPSCIGFQAVLSLKMLN